MSLFNYQNFKNTYKPNYEVRSVHKIIKHKDKYVMFYSSWCSYSRAAMDKIKNSGEQYRFYDIDTVPGGLDAVLESLSKNSELTKFNQKHTTSPIIFYKGKFIGGYSEL